MENNALISIDDLSKSFDQGKRWSLSHINAQFQKGKMIGVVGPDGAGKTTLIRLIAGLLLPTSGTIRVNGFDSVTQAEDIHQFLGYMPQKFGLYEDLTVQQNLDLYADLRGLSKVERPATYERLLAFTSLGNFTDRLAGALSGGMKQKLGLACTLIRSPLLLLLDEPSVGVDPVSRRELWTMVQQLLHQGITVVWSTAYLDEAAKCDEVLLLHEGKVLFFGAPSLLTNEMQGRTFQIKGIDGSRRNTLFEALRNEDVIDGVIQGKAVRIVMKKGKSPPSNHLGEIVPVPPRFEDAFIDRLGGGPGGYSLLAEKTERHPYDVPIVAEAKELVKKFGSFTAVDHVTFSIPPGEIFGLLGPNGAGKTTTFKMMCGLLKPTQGEAYVTGLNLGTASGQARARIGYMAQKFSLYGDLSVLQNLNFFSGIYNLSGSHRRHIIQEMIDTFSLKPYLDTSASLLPLGFKQRLALSCAVMHRPQVLFLDEPTSGVDPITRREFWNHINGLVEKGVTVLVTTHFMDEAEYCDRIGLIYRSKMIRMGTPDELKEFAKTPEKPSPTLEDAFIELIETYDREQPR